MELALTTLCRRVWQAESTHRPPSRRNRTHHLSGLLSADCWSKREEDVTTLSLVIFQSFLWPERFLYGCSAQNVDHQEQSPLRPDLLLPGRILHLSSGFTPVRLSKTLLTSVCFSVSSLYESVPQPQIMKGHGVEPCSLQRKGGVTLLSFMSGILSVPAPPLSAFHTLSPTAVTALGHVLRHSMAS